MKLTFLGSLECCLTVGFAKEVTRDAGKFPE